MRPADLSNDGGPRTTARPNALAGRLAFGVGLLLSVVGCASRPPHTRPPIRPAAALAARAPQAFTDRVPTSTATFTMRPVPAGDGATPFWIGETEMTWDAYDVFMLRLDLSPDERTGPKGDPGPDAVTRPTLPYTPPDRGWGHDGFPAIGVTAFAAQRYCEWLSDRTGRRYRLPTVAEWRHACRLGAADGRGDQAWSAGNAHEQTHAVATRSRDALGLHDLLGNVAEWCIDDATGKPVACGGSFRTDAADLTCDLVEPQSPEWNQSDPSFPKSKWWLADAPFVGFRVVCDGPAGRPAAEPPGARR